MLLAGCMPTQEPEQTALDFGEHQSFTLSKNDGVILYNNNCSRCHGIDINSSTKLGRSADQITNAIDLNMGGMGEYSFLSTAEINAIALALSPIVSDSINGSDPLSVVDEMVAASPGVELYQTNCMQCHGDISVSTKHNKTFLDIQNAIDQNIGGMGEYSFLTLSEVEQIADALVVEAVAVVEPAAAAPTGAELYNNNCMSCHGSLDLTNKTGSSALQIQQAIDSNKGGMGKLSNLTSEEVQSIADALAP